MRRSTTTPRCRGGLILALVAALCGGALGAPETASAAPDPATADAEIQANLETIFAQVPSFGDVDAHVRSGVVTLGGTTLSAAARDDALELVRGVEGVRYVVDDLEQEADLGRTLTPALARLRDYAVTAFRYSPLFVVAVVLVALFSFLGWLVGRWNTPFETLGLNPLLRGLLQQLVRTAFVLVGVLLALDLLGATAVVTAVLGTAGLAGLAVGFAFRDIVENYLAGVLLSLRQPFAVGDHLLLATYEGRVVRLTSRELVLMTLDGNHVRIPNATVFGSVTTNFTRNPLRRFEFELVVAAHEDITAVHELCVRALRALPGVLAEPRPQVRPLALEEGVRFGVLGWVDQRGTDFRKVKAEAIRAVKEALEGAGVDTPESVVQVRVTRAAAETAAKHEPARPHSHPKGVDVSLEHELDAQLAEELTDPDEPNLLEPPRDPSLRR